MIIYIHIFQYGWKPVLIHQILIGFEVILENILHIITIVWSTTCPSIYLSFCYMFITIKSKDYLAEEKKTIYQSLYIVYIDQAVWIHFC